MKMGLSEAIGDWPPLAIQTAFLAYCGLIVFLSVLYYETAERWLHRRFKQLLGIAVGP